LAESGGMLLANGLDYPSWPEIREATSTVVVTETKGKADRQLLRASLDKAPWRVLNALTVKTVSMGDIGGPIALDNLSGNEAFDLWVGALVADQAKVLDTVEGVYHLPATMLLNTGQQRYENGISFAETIASQLRRAVSTYHREVGDNLDRAEMRDRRRELQRKATIHYWTQGERMLPRLMDAVNSSEPLKELHEWAETAWGRALRRSAREAYEMVSPHETARQIQAFVKGLSELSSGRNPALFQSKI
jgi:CRISPR system Cascade subunit CasA